jgi:hypothetical protein
MFSKFCVEITIYLCQSVLTVDEKAGYFANIEKLGSETVMSTVKK